MEGVSSRAVNARRSCQSHCRFATTRVNGRQRLGGACTTHPCAAGSWSSATDPGFINVFWAWMTATPQLRHSSVSTASPQDREVTLAKRIGRSHEGQRVDRNWLMIGNIYAIWSEECEPDHTLRGDYRSRLAMRPTAKTSKSPTSVHSVSLFLLGSARPAGES
jgi:hypothetical protein